MPASSRILTRQHFANILRNAGHIAVSFSHLLPHSQKEVCGERIAEEDRKLVYEYPCTPTCTPVLDYAVINALQNNQHTHREQLLTEIEDIVRGQAIVLVNIGFLRENGQRTGDKQFRCKRKLLRFRLRLTLDLGLRSWSVSEHRPCIHWRYMDDKQPVRSGQ